MPAKLPAKGIALDVAALFDLVIKLLGAGAVGAFVTWLLAKRAEKARWDRDDRLRWQADKRALYARYLTSIDNHHSTVGINLTWLEVDPGDEDGPDSPDLYAADLVRQEMALLAPAKVVRAADRLYDLEVRHHITMIRAIGERAGVEHEDVVERVSDEDYRAVRAQLVSVMREDLGIPDEGPPSPPV